MTHRGPQSLAKEIEVCDADGGNAHRFPLVEDRFGRLLWDQGSVPAEDAEPGTELTKTWDYFGGGSGETYDLEELLQVKTGGYYFSDDCQVSNPYAIRPRQVVTSVTLTNNNAEVTHLFEAKSASDTKYLYALNNIQGYKIKLDDQSLVNTKAFTTPDVAVATGSYIGTGGVGPRAFLTNFAPLFCIIKADHASTAFVKIEGMSTWSYKAATGAFTTGDSSDYIAFTASAIGFTGATNFNTSGRTYHWLAIGGSATYVKASSFTGDGNDDKDVTIAASWGQPDALFIATNNSSDPICFRNKTDTADSTCDLSASGATIANIVEASADWPTDGFEVGSDNRANRSGATVYYFAIKQDGGTDHCTIGSHTGDGVDPQAVTGVGYESEYLLLYTDSGTSGVKPTHRSDTCAGDSSMYFDATANAANLTQSLDSDGYSVGDDNSVNENTKTFYALMLRTDPLEDVTCGQPAEWNSVWELPQGATVDRIGLTTIADGTSNDTWTARSTGSPKASHLCVVENELVRASADRMIDKCSALDTDVDANWTGDYYVGQPGTKITKLVNVGGEVGVGTTDGFYLFDLIAQSRQQLPLLGGIIDDDNAKGATVVGTLTLVPTVAGAWRILGGSALPFGPDANKFYAEVEGPSSVPIHLKSYGFAFLGTYIYNAVYDGTNYHIIYTQLSPSDPTLLRAKWDFLLTHTNKIKTLFIDSEARLWFGYGDNIAYVTLLRDGKPEGGSWGETSGSGNFYHPVTRMGTNALKRFRLIEIEVDSMPANYNWSASVYRDGGSVESVGSAITSDGVGECFWTAGTSDTGREILVRTNWAGDGSYSAQSTPPEVKRVTLHADPLTEDADLIVCSIDLSENAKEKMEIVESKLNSAAIKLIDPLTAKKHTVVLYRRRVYQVRQQGTLPPKAACELRFRRSDVS